MDFSDVTVYTEVNRRQVKKNVLWRDLKQNMYTVGSSFLNAPILFSSSFPRIVLLFIPDSHLFVSIIVLVRHVFHLLPYMTSACV